MNFLLSHDTPRRIELRSTKHYNLPGSVFFSIFNSKDYITTVSFTAAEARTFAQALIEQAEGMEKLDKEEAERREASKQKMKEGRKHA